jgi:hypothetical protein
MKVTEITVKQKISDQEISKLEGTYFTEDDFDIIIKDDSDIYRLDAQGRRHLLLKIRKNVIPKEICNQAFFALEEEAKKPHTNRGAAAGLLTKRKLPAYVKEIAQKGKFRGKYYGHDDRLRKDDISNMARSGIIGFYDQIDRNYYRRLSRKKDKTTIIVPCRTTKFTKDQPEKWKETFAFFEAIDQQFKSLVPEAHEKQYQRASKTPDFQILDTAFSTATINYNWQTALHRDIGDFDEGFGNLVVLEDPKQSRQKWSGGYLGFPQYGLAVDVRNGDFLAMDVHQWHSNTPIISDGENEHVRLSVVSYLRKNMLKCANTNIQTGGTGGTNGTGGQDESLPPSYNRALKLSSQKKSFSEKSKSKYIKNRQKSIKRVDILGPSPKENNENSGGHFEQASSSNSNSNQPSRSKTGDEFVPE